MGTRSASVYMYPTCTCMYMYVVNVLIPPIQEVLMNIRVPKSAKGYKIVAETFGQRYVYMWQQYNCSTCTCSYIVLSHVCISGFLDEG